MILEKSKEYHDDALVILHTVDWTKEDHPPFFVCLMINDFLLHNCMYDSGASSNVITNNSMEMLNLKIIRPYHNVCAMDSRDIETHMIILNLQVKLATYPDITFPMDILVIDVLDAWGMLLSRKWVASMGDNIQWTYHMPPSHLLKTHFSNFIGKKKENSMWKIQKNP